MKSVLKIFNIIFIFYKYSRIEVKIISVCISSAGKSLPYKPEFAFFLIVTYTCLGKRELLTVKNEELKISERRIKIKREKICFGYLNI